MSFLPPVVLEIRAQAAQFFAETARVAEATKAMATEAGAATAGMADKVSASAATMGNRVAAFAEAMALKTSAETEAMARRIIAESEQMNVGTTGATEAMVRNVIASFEAMTVKTAASMQKQSTATVAAMERQTKAVIASQEAMAATVVEASAVIEAAVAKVGAATTRTASQTTASGLKMQESFIQTAATAVGTTGAMSSALATAAITQSQAAAGASANLMGIANGITKVAGVTALVMAGIGLNMAAHFEKSTMLLVTAGGESKNQLEGIRSGILNIAKDTGTSTEQLSEGMYVMEKAGYRGAMGLAALRAAAEGAKAENVDLATMTDALSTVMLDYGYDMSTATAAGKSSISVTNQIIAASGAAKTTMQDYVASMAAVVPIASSAKISFAEVGGAIATMTQHGQTAQQSSQNLANLIQALIKPNNMASAAMQQMGLDTVDLAQNLGPAGLSGTLKKVQQAVLDNMGPAGLVVMDTMKKSASATAALRTEMGTMPPEMAKLSQGLLDGSTSILQYTKASKGMGGGAGAVATQFLTLYKSSQGVNDSLKSGQPAMMTYQAAMTKVLGNVTAARAATMLLMNSSDDLNRSIQLVSDAADQGGQHIHTWADTQALLSTQLDMAKQRSAVLAIEIGNKLIPAANGALQGFQELWDGFEKGNPILLGIAGVIGGAVTLSVVNFTIKLVQAGIATVVQLGQMGAAAILMGTNFVAGFLSAEAAASSFTGKMGTAGGEVRAGLLPALGALGVAAAGAAIYIGVMSANTQLYIPNAEAMRKAILDLAGVTGKVSTTGIENEFKKWNVVMGSTTTNIGNVDQAVQTIAKTDGLSAWLDHLTDGMAKGLGISGSALGQVEDHFKAVGVQLGQLTQGGQTDTAAKAFDKLAESFVRNGKSAQDALDSMPAYKQSLIDMAAASGQTLGPAELLELAMGKVPKSMQDAAKASETYTDSAGNVRNMNADVKKAFDDVGVAIDGQITNLGKLYDAMVKTGLANLSARDAEFHFGDAVSKATEEAVALKTQLNGDLSTALNKNATDFSKTTGAGQKAEAAFSSVTQAGLQTASIMAHDVTKSAEDVTKSLHGTYDSMIATAKGFGLGDKAAEALTRTVLGIPPGVKIDSWMADTAKRMADQTKKSIDDIDKHPVVMITVKTAFEKAVGLPGDQIPADIARPGLGKGGYTGGSVASIMGMFDGGVIPGTPPSNPRVDNILAMVNGKPLKVQSGEFLVNGQQTKANMPWLKAVNAGLNLSDVFAARTPQLAYAASSSLTARREGLAPVTNNDNSRSIANHVVINSTADARSLAAEFSRITANMS